MFKKVQICKRFALKAVTWQNHDVNEFESKKSIGSFQFVDAIHPVKFRFTSSKKVVFQAKAAFFDLFKAKSAAILNIIQKYVFQIKM